jgi:hydrogenase/urease accessory protein HupE
VKYVVRRWHRLLAALLLATTASTALAHSFEPALLDIHERQPGVFDVRWRSPGPGSGFQALGVDELLPQLPAHCHLTATGPSTWRADCGAAGLHGATLSVQGIEASRVDVIVRINWRDGSTATGAVHASAPQFVIPGGRGAANDDTTARIAWSYLGLGAEHIWLGYDHLLFVLGLMLLVDSWRMLLKTISAFTVAHSITLAAAVLGLVHVPPAPVEALIAMSIVLLALELTRPPDEPPTLTRRYPWVVAFIFGLLHGLGFAGALVEIGVPPERIALALLSFNLGVEAGQLTFVVAMLGPLALARHLTQRWPQARLVPAYAIGALAVTWTLERVQRFWL